MSYGEIIGIVTGIVSIILGGFSIILAIVLYFKSRTHELNVSTLLENIKTQAENLKSISNKFIDKLLDHVTNKPPTEAEKLLPTLIAMLPGQNSLSQKSSADEDEHITILIVSLFYTTQTNYFAQLCSNITPDFQLKALNLSYADYLWSLEQIKKIDIKKLESHRLFQVYTDTITNWAPLIKDKLA